MSTTTSRVWRCSCCPRPATGVVVLLDDVQDNTDDAGGLVLLCEVCLGDAVDLGLVDPHEDHPTGLTSPTTTAAAELAPSLDQAGRPQHGLVCTIGDR